jgi:hypothetical protein
MAGKYRFDPLVENFTLSVLSKLRRRSTESIISSPKTSLRKWNPTKPKALGAADLICFPWAIIEVKTTPWKETPRKETPQQFCYCQAANASAQALVMREKLAAQVDEPSVDALVIFAFTCIGPTVRLWVTYRSLVSVGVASSCRAQLTSVKNKNIEMRCVWATSLELTWGVFALRMVIENMREWVYQRVKPEIAKWISKARTRAPSQVFLTPGGHRSKHARAASLDPPRVGLRSASPGTPTRSSRAKATRTLSRGKTAPSRVYEPGDSELSEDEKNSELSESEEGDSEWGEREWKADEGYSSDDGHSVETSECESSEDSDAFSDRFDNKLKLGRSWLRAPTTVTPKVTLRRAGQTS